VRERQERRFYARLAWWYALRMLKRPKSGGRCIHCRERLVEKTKDHVFPSSWYPDSTSRKVQRWTVPSCKRCNGEFGEMERELFVRLAICIDPRKVEATGISIRAIRSLGVGTMGLSQKERRHREALAQKVLGDVKAYSGDNQASVLPGMGPHPEFPLGQYVYMPLPGQMLHAVAKKIVRGSEYWLANGRIIEPPYEIEVFFPRQVPQELLQALENFGPVQLGPGFRVRRAGAIDDSGVGMYQIVVWASLTIYAVILPPEGPSGASIPLALRCT
jgi:hypothetical protein